MLEREREKSQIRGLGKSGSPANTSNPNLRNRAQSITSIESKKLKSRDSKKRASVMIERDTAVLDLEGKKIKFERKESKKKSSGGVSVRYVD